MNGAETCIAEGAIKHPGIVQDATLSTLLKTNWQLRLFVGSVLVNHLGDWFNYIACIKLIESVYPESYTFVSVLVILRLVPKLLFSTPGGVLSDVNDRRLNLIRIDLACAIVSSFYLLALHLRSVRLLYALVFCHEIAEALGDPSSEAMFPQIVRDEKQLEVARMFYEVAYAAVAAFGASLGGFCATLLGTRACFLLDSITYLISACMLSRLHGSWTADKDEESDIDEELSEGEVSKSNSQDSCCQDGDSQCWISRYHSMVIDGMKYIWNNSVRPLVLIKATGMIIYGATEVLAVSFSDKAGEPDSSSARLGIIYAFYGIGCIVGPLLRNVFSDIKNPRSLQSSCIASFAVISISWVGMAQFADSFISKCLFMALASCGAEILWLDSDLLIMIFSKNMFLGRVTSIDSLLAVACESLSTLIAGILQDHAHLTAEEVSGAFGAFGFGLVLIWCTYHICGWGVPSSRSDTDQSKLSTAGENSDPPWVEPHASEKSPLFLDVEHQRTKIGIENSL